VIDLATLPMAPSSSPVTKRILLGILLGLGIGMGLATLIEYFNQPIETEEEVAELTGLPVLGWLPLAEVGRVKNGRAHEPLNFVEGPALRALPAEGCRSIRTSLESLSRQRPLHTVMLTSPGPREGKSTIVLNLGWTFWELGHRLIMVDADLRRPSLHRALRFPAHTGLVELLTGAASLEQVQRPIKPDFSFLPAGATKGANPGSILSAEKIRNFLEIVKDRADLVLFDSAPVLAVSDNLILASMVDAVILVVRAGHTQRRDLLRAKDQLEKVGAPIVGIVLNEVSPRDTRRYYSRYADYYGAEDVLTPRKGQWNPLSWWRPRPPRGNEKGVMR
jgi:capsular exopolysaccharide synthesis family protein